MILGDRKFVEIPGSKTHELPPLLVRTAPGVKRLDRVVEMAEGLIDQEEIIPPGPLDADPGHALELQRRRMDLALNLTEQYLTFRLHWRWGDDVLEWIRQCEITFEHRADLRNLLRPDVWPHAGRSSFVTLLEDKAVPTEGVDIEKAVGLRLTFRQAPPLEVFSDQFLFYLNHSLADTAYQTWAHLSPDPTSALPPERFSIHVVAM